MFFATSDDDHRRNVGYCYEILPPHISRDETLHYGPNPPFVIGFPERQSSKGELYEIHKNNGTLGIFSDLYPDR
jgi:hypothetical protein